MSRLGRAIQYTWPEIKHDCITDPEDIGTGWLRFETWIRKECEGKYYLIPIVRSYSFGARDLTPTIPAHLQSFCREVYIVQMLYKLPCDYKNQFGEDLILEDLCTISEQDRIRQKYIPLSIIR